SGLPTSDLVQEYRTIYGCLHDLCDGKSSAPFEVSERSDVLSQSHRAAMEIVKHYEAGSLTQCDKSFSQHILPDSGWVYDRIHGVKNGTISTHYGGDLDTIYLPPALRLAYAITCALSNQTDFGSVWMREQAGIHTLLLSEPCEHVISGDYRHFREPHRTEVFD